MTVYQVWHIPTGNLIGERETPEDAETFIATHDDAPREEWVVLEYQEEP